MQSRKKRCFRILGVVCLVILVPLLGLPLWFPWLLRPTLAHLGIAFDSYERVGYTRFALANVRGQFGNAQLNIKRIAGSLPPRWVWRRYFKGADDEHFLTVTAWHLQIEHGELSQPTGTSAFMVAEEINRQLPVWRTWLPRAKLTDGKIQAGSNEVRVAAAEWHRGKLTATGESSKPRETFVLNCDFSAGPPYPLALDAKSSGVTSRVLLSRATDQWRAAGELNWWSNRVELEAGFGRGGWWPEQASVKSDRFRVPAKFISLAGYVDLTGAFAVDWMADRFRLEATARAASQKPESTFSPALELSLLVRGDSDSAVVEKLKITSSAIQAELSDPIGLSRSGHMTTDAATLRVALDLAKLEGFSLGGKLQGQVRVRPMPGGRPSAEFDLKGEELTGRGISIARTRFAGLLRWPELTLNIAELEFADGSTLGGAAELHLESRQVSNGTWRFQGPWARQFLPAGILYSNLQATGRISGSPGAWLHSGEMTAEGFAAPHLKPSASLARGEERISPSRKRTSR